MPKKNPVEQLLSRKKKKRQKNKSVIAVPRYVASMENSNGLGRIMKTENELRKEAIRNAIETRIAQYKVKKGEEELEFEEEEESEDIEELKEMIAEILAILRGEAESEAAAEEEGVEEFPDADEVKAAVALVKKYGGVQKIKKILVSKEEEKHKPKEETSEVSTGKDKREIEENDFKDFEEQGDESPKRASENVLSEKANYKNEYGKPKELPEKSQLSQKVIPQDTIPSESSVSRTTSKTVTGRGMETGGVASFEKGEESNSSAVFDILKGNKKARDIAKSNNGGVFGW
jgi:hypothetical protein